MIQELIKTDIELDYIYSNLSRLLNRDSVIRVSPESLIEKYFEPHRFYHNIDHIKSMIRLAQTGEFGQYTEDLFLAIVLHDIIYDPKSKHNEEESAVLAFYYFKNESIRQAILDTKTHIPTSELSVSLCALDMTIFGGTIEELIDYENKIFKEYQYIDYKTYKEGRIDFLTKNTKRTDLIDYVKHRKPNIAVYAGSFNPFHKGHYNILQKAECVFDKVIIARGINDSKKDNKIVELPSLIQNRQIETYDGLLTDFIDGLGHDVTLIRGLRNSANSLQEEYTQYRYLQDLKPDIKVSYLFCDAEFDHYSSSAIRSLEKYDKQEKYLL